MDHLREFGWLPEGSQNVIRGELMAMIPFLHEKKIRLKLMAKLNNSKEFGK